MSGKKLIGRRRSSIRVCYLIDVAPDFYTGGGQAHLTNLVREFKRSDPDVTSGSDLIIFGGQNPNIIFRFFWMLYVIPQVVFYHFFRQKFTLIHAHSVPAMAAGKILSLVLGIPIVVTIHGSLVSNQESPWRMPRRLLTRLLEKWILTRIKCDAQITVSRDFLEVPNVNKNVVYIPNGVDLEVFKGPALGYQGRALSNKTMLFVGRKNDPVKGFTVLEEAMKLVKQEIPEAKLLAADGSVSRDEVTKMYLRANLFVLPSLSEGFPLTLLEAWAARLPVVATAVGEVRSFANFSRENSLSDVCETSWGYVLEPGNPKSLARGIITALKNKHLAKLGQNGYNLARKFSWSSVARKTAKVYNEVLSSDM